MDTSLRVLGLVTALVLWAAELATAQVATAFGPRDGAGLSPTDLARIAIGSQAPDFTLESKDGGTVTLSSFRGRKDVVLIFYRGHW
jgi:cytochrome oxidase Cu insertion factor (SCO1/SenC/PrrC family)